MAKVIHEFWERTGQKRTPTSAGDISRDAFASLVPPKKLAEIIFEARCCPPIFEDSPQDRP
jgi:hypothetical protein